MSDCLVLLSEDDTACLARILAAQLRFGDEVLLKGDLGAGKTTLVRHVVMALGGNPQEVASPSFTLQNEYGLPQGKRIEHWDLYRLKEAPQELYEPCDPAAIRFIEWPERAPFLFSEAELLILIEVDAKAKRLVSFSGAKALDVDRIAQGILSKGDNK